LSRQQPVRFGSNRVFHPCGYARSTNIFQFNLHETRCVQYVNVKSEISQLMNGEEYPKLVDSISIHPLDDGFGSKAYVLQTKSIGCWKVSKSLGIILWLMDGETSISTIINKCNVNYGIPITEADLQRLIEDKLRPIGLLDIDASLQKHSRNQKSLSFVRITLVPPRWVDIATAYLKRLFSPVLVRALVVIYFLSHLIFFYVFPLPRVCQMPPHVYHPCAGDVYQPCAGDVYQPCAPHVYQPC
jgi:hypothetical protein